AFPSSGLSWSRRVEKVTRLPSLTSLTVQRSSMNSSSSGSSSGSPTAVSLDQSIADRNENSTRPHSSRAAVRACTHRSAGTDTLMVSKAMVASPPTASATELANSVSGCGASAVSCSGASASGWLEVTLIPLLANVFPLDLLLEQDDALQKRLGPGWAAGHVDIGGDHLIHALGDRVGVPVGAAGGRARAHGDDVLGPGHLLAEALERRRHLVGHRARHDHEVGLAGRGGQRDDP